MHVWHKAALYLTSITLVACSASPTGRKQILLFSNQEMSSLGAQSFEEMKKSTAIEKDKKINAYVQCVANTVTTSVPKDGFSQWEVVVFKSDEINAFALPGGKIGVYTGLLKVAKNQDQLATVIGHEVAHVLAEHGNERMSQAQLTNAGLQLTNIAIGASEYAQYQQITMSALGLGVQYGVTLPYGRKQESEADVVGLELMANSGFDPLQSIELWKNMAAASNGAQTPELLSTHPSHETRMKDLTEKAATLAPFSGSKPHCG